MTRERINDFKKIVLPSISKFLFDVNYEGQGKCDAEEFAKDFNEILDLAAKALENKPRFLVQSDGKIEQITEPCDDALNKITGELKTVKEKWWYGVDNDCFMKLSDVLQIIDKYRKNDTHDKTCMNCFHNYGVRHNTEFNPEDIVCEYWESDGLTKDDFCSRWKDKEEETN